MHPVAIMVRSNCRFANEEMEKSLRKATTADLQILFGYVANAPLYDDKTIVGVKVFRASDNVPETAVTIVEDGVCKFSWDRFDYSNTMEVSC
jgi:hypothetical protein